MNWFGVKLGEKDKLPTSAASTAGAGAGVGKYLNAPAAPATSAGAPKRPAPAAPVVDDGKKKRKLGFGNFDAW